MAQVAGSAPHREIPFARRNVPGSLHPPSTGSDVAGSYAHALAKVGELEVELASAVGALQRSLADNATLQQLHDEAVQANLALKEQHKVLQDQLEKEHNDHDKLVQELTTWRSQLEAKARELEAMQRIQLDTQDDGSRRLFGEVEARLLDRVSELEDALSGARRQVATAERQQELAAARLAACEADLREEREQSSSALEERLAALRLEHERRLAALQVEVREQRDAATWAESSLQAAEEKVGRLEKVLAELEEHSGKEHSAAAQELQRAVVELAAARRRGQDLQVELDQANERCSAITSEVEALRPERDRLSERLAEEHQRALQLAERAKKAEQLEADLESLRSTSQASQEASAKVVEETREHCETFRKDLAKALERGSDLEEKISQRQAELVAAQKTHAEELAALRERLEKGQEEKFAAEMQHEKQASALLRRAEDAEHRAANLDSLQARRHAENAELEGQLKVLRKEIQEREAIARADLAEVEEKHARRHAMAAAAASEADKELAKLRGEVANLHTDLAQEKGRRQELNTAVTGLQQSLQACKRQRDVFQAEIAELHVKIDIERDQWMKEADHGCEALLNAEEERRKKAIRQHTEEQNTLVSSIQQEHKRNLHKAARRHRELKQRCLELARRVAAGQKEGAGARASHQKLEGLVRMA